MYAYQATAIDARLLARRYRIVCKRRGWPRLSRDSARAIVGTAAIISRCAGPRNTKRELMLLAAADGLVPPGQYSTVRSTGRCPTQKR
jgi:hypothetical protein